MISLAAVWPMIAGACLILAAISLRVSAIERARLAYLLFAFMALAVAGVAVCEMLMMRAQTIEQFGSAQRWMQVPAFIIVVSMVWFVRTFIGAERLWLAYAICTLRLVALIVNFSSGANLNYRQITALRQIRLWGGEVVTAADGVLNPWTWLGQLTLLLLVVYVLDAAVTAWRRGDRDARRRAANVGGSIAVCVLAAGTDYALVLEQVISPPYIIAPTFFFVLLAMGYELSADVVRSDWLGRLLRASNARLRDSDRQMDLAADAAGLGLWQWEVGRDEVSISSIGRELFGFAPDEGISREQLLSCIHPDDREDVREGINASLRGGVHYEKEFRIVLPDGGTRWLASRGRVEPGEDGAAALMCGVSFDVTARRRFDQTLLETEGRFRTMADAAPVMMWMAGTDKSCTFFNRAWLEFTGRTMKEELGNGWTDDIHPADAERCLRTYTDAFDARRDFAMEYRLRRHDGEYRWIVDNGAPRFAADGTFAGYIGSCFDVTELRRAEERLRLVVEAAPNAVIMVDEAGGIALVNERVTALFGYAQAEIIGRPIEMLVPAALRSVHRAHRDAYWLNPGQRPMGMGRELYGQRKDGSRVPLEVGLSPIHTSEGTFILASIVDITERRRMEVEMASQRSELAHLSRVNLLGELSGSLAHELNQPLTAILSNAQAALRFLANDPGNVDELRDILEDIVDDDKRAGDVIRRLRVLFKKGEPHHEFVDVNEIVQDVMGLMRSDFVNRDVKVDADLAPNLPSVRGDRIQLQQVLLNLIVNGCDAMEGVGDHRARLLLETRLAQDNGVEVAVTDYGRGIGAAEMERIFEPFFTTKPLGMGLGLAVCKTIINSHGGHLGAANNASGGATFSFSMPAEQGANET